MKLHPLKVSILPNCFTGWKPNPQHRGLWGTRLVILQWCGRAGVEDRGLTPFCFSPALPETTWNCSSKLSLLNVDSCDSSVSAFHLSALWHQKNQSCFWSTIMSPVLFQENKLKFSRNSCFLPWIWHKWSIRCLSFIDGRDGKPLEARSHSKSRICSSSTHDPQSYSLFTLG